MPISQYLCTLILFLSGFITPHFNAPEVETSEKAMASATVIHHSTYTEFLDVPYGDAEKDYHLLDAYLPEERTPNTKVIVYIHGGSWVAGNKSEFPKPLIEELVGKRKYALASINYRLVKDGKNLFPAQIEDIQKALSFISDNAAEYHYNGDEFALMGASAGAHLALLYAYGFDPKKQVKTVVDIFGPTDLSDASVRKPGLESNDIIVNYLGTSDVSAQIVQQASPYFHLTQQSGVPTILFHGSSDGLVNPQQSEKLYKKLQELHIPSLIKLYPGEKHELRPQIAADVFANIIAWLEEYYR